jgi:hypothetical protein
MGWLRSRLKQGSYIALFAMALQLVLSFSHVHLQRSSASSQQSFFAHAKTSTFGILPPEELPPGADDECPICALIQLAGSLILPVPAAVRVPIHFASVQHEPTLNYYVAATTLQPFQARAPPLV